ncbi:MAG: Lipoprotein signal peptidase [Firmicutes bacterium]|nr:Lipoprotein signal peptidase [Bacillota bacterium]
MPVLFLAFIVIGIDRLSKYYVETHMSLGMSIPVIRDLFHITYIINPGAAFGILEYQTGFFIVVSVVMIAAAIWYVPRIPARYRLLRFGIGIQAGGAIGNLIDRIRYGGVVDFLDFRIWPVFNVADMAIVGGVGCILVTLLYVMRKEEEKQWL